MHDVFSTFHTEDYLARNATAGTVFVYPWKRYRHHSNGKGSKAGQAWKVVPDGRYKIVAQALKALGDAGNTAHWETFVSDTITIDRP